jgi:hypothetical protein
MLNEFEIENENIFIVGSSGVAVKKNTQVLAILVWQLRTLNFVDANN